MTIPNRPPYLLTAEWFAERENDLHLGKLQGMFRVARNVFRNGKPLALAGGETTSEVGGFWGGTAIVPHSVNSKL